MTSKLSSNRLCFLSLLLCLAVAPLQSHAANSKPKPNVKAWKTSLEGAETAAKAKDYPDEEIFLQAALTEAENFDVDDYRLAETLSLLGDFYLQTRRFAQAEPLFRRAVAIRHGDPNPLTEAVAQRSFAFVSQQLKHYDDAEKAYLRAQELFSRKLGADHPVTVRCMFYLGTLYDDQREYAKAEPLLKRSLALFENPATRMQTRKTDSAGRGLQVWVGAFKPDYAFALDALVRLSGIYTKQNRPADAEATMKKSLVLIDERLAQNDASVALALNQSAAMCLALTNYAGAEPFLLRYATLKEKTDGPAHPTTLNTETQLALVYEREGKLPEAEALYKKVIAASAKAGNGEGIAVIAAEEPLIQLYFRQQRYQDAEPLVASQLAAAEKSQSALASLPVLAEQATIYSKLGRDSELEGVYKKQLAVCEKMFGPNHKTVAKILTDYAALLHKLKRDSEAEGLEARLKNIDTPVAK